MPHSEEKWVPELHFFHGSRPAPLQCSCSLLHQPAGEAEVGRVTLSRARESPGPCDSVGPYVEGLGWGLRFCVSKNLAGAARTAEPWARGGQGSSELPPNTGAQALPSPPGATHPFSPHLGFWRGEVESCAVKGKREKLRKVGICFSPQGS